MGGSRILFGLTAFLVLAVSPVAEARQYAGASHYRVTVPDDWTQTSVSSGVDVAFVGPASQGFAANLNVVVVSGSSARNEQAWLLRVAQGAYSQVVSQFPGATGFQTPRSFTTASGRPAADYVIDYELSGTPLRVRQVLFASDFWNSAYILTFTAHRDAYNSQEPVWSTAVDTFTVLDEGGAVSAIAIAAISGGLVAAAVAIAVTVARRRRKVPPIVPGAPSAPSAAEPPSWPPPPPPPPPPGTGP